MSSLKSPKQEPKKLQYRTDLTMRIKRRRQSSHLVQSRAKKKASQKTRPTIANLPVRYFEF